MNTFHLETEITAQSTHLDNNLMCKYQLPNQTRLQRVIDNTQILACQSTLDVELTHNFTYQATGVFGVGELLK